MSLQVLLRRKSTSRWSYNSHNRHLLSAVVFVLHFSFVKYSCFKDNRVFRKLTDLTFLSFLYKINITGFENQQKKIASTGYWTHNTNPTIEIPATLPTQPICQSMSVSNFQTLIKSCSIEPEMIQVQFMNLVFNRCLCGWMGKVAGISNSGVGVVSSIPSGGNFFFADFETPWC